MKLSDPGRPVRIESRHQIEVANLEIPELTQNRFPGLPLIRIPPVGSIDDRKHEHRQSHVAFGQEVLQLRQARGDLVGDGFRPPVLQVALHQ